MQRNDKKTHKKLDKLPDKTNKKQKKIVTYKNICCKN